TGRQTRKLLLAEGIAKSLGVKPLFSGLDLELVPGTKLGLLGANGSGKSTLLRVLAGDIAPDTGTIAKAENLRRVMIDQGRATLNPAGPPRQALSPHRDSRTYGHRS